MTFRPTRPTLSCSAALAAVFVAELVGAARPASGQVRVVIEGGVVIEAGQPAVDPGLRPLPPGAAEFTIGDPWWDQWERERAAEAGKPPAVEPDGGRLQAQARLIAVRQSRGTQILRRELSRVRAACPELDPPVRGAILAAGRAAVGGQAAGRTPLVGGVEAALEQALRDRVGSEAAAAYRAELEARSTRQKQAAVVLLVEAVDREAVLDSEARRALAAAIRDQWRPEWEAIVMTAARRRISEPSLPAGVADAVATALDDETFATWRKRVEEKAR